MTHECKHRETFQGPLDEANTQVAGSDYVMYNPIAYRARETLFEEYPSVFFNENFDSFGFYATGNCASVFVCHRERLREMGLYEENSFSANLGSIYSLVVPAGIQMTLYEEQHFGGKSLAIKGPMKIPIFEEYSSIISKGFRSYKIEKLTGNIRIVVTNFKWEERITVEESPDTPKVYEFQNHHGEFIENEISFTYTETQESNWMHSEGITSSSSASSSKSSSSSIEHNWGISVTVSASSGGFGASVSGSTTASYGGSASESESDSSSSTYEYSNNLVKEGGGFQQTTEEKSFSMKCPVPAYTKSTCIITLLKGTYEVPYDAVRIYEYDDEVVTDEYEGMYLVSGADVVKTDTSSEFFGCEGAFAGIDNPLVFENRYCLKALTDNTMTFDEAALRCYKEKMTMASSYSDAMNFEIHKLCDFKATWLYGTLLQGDTGEVMWFNNEVVEYNRFNDMYIPVFAGYNAVNADLNEFGFAKSFAIAISSTGEGKWALRKKDNKLTTCVVCMKEIDAFRLNDE